MFMNIYVCLCMFIHIHAKFFIGKYLGNLIFASYALQFNNHQI